MPEGPRTKVSRKESCSHCNKRNAQMRRRKHAVQHNSIRNIHAVVLGKDGVGKSALTVRLLTGRFIGEYDSSLDSIYRHHLEVEGNYISLDIMDTAGENTEEKLQQCSAFGNLFLLLFSITDRASFKEARRLGRFIKRTKISSAYSTVLVGTKRDLGEYRAVWEHEGETLANEIGATYHEISSAEGCEETKNLLQEAVRTHLQSRLTDRDTQSKGLGKLKEGLRVRTKSLNRKRGMTV